MKNQLPLLVIFCLFLFSGCGKKGVKLCNVKEIIIDNSSTDKISYSYDELGRISEFMVDIYRYEVVYDGLVGELNTYEGSTLTFTVDLTFDSEGRITSYEYVETEGADEYKTRSVYKYNEEGFLVSFKNTYINISESPDDTIRHNTDTLIYSGENLISKTRRNKEGEVIRTYVYTYTTLLNNALSPWAFRDPYTGNINNNLYLLIGKQNKNLINTITFTDTNPDLTITYEFTYKVNSNGDVSEYNLKSTPDGESSTTTNYKFKFICD